MEAGLPEPVKGPAVEAVTTLGDRNDASGSLVSWSQAGGAWASGEAGSPRNSEYSKKEVERTCPASLLLPCRLLPLSFICGTQEKPAGQDVLVL